MNIEETAIQTLDWAIANRQLPPNGIKVGLHLWNALNAFERIKIENHPFLGDCYFINSTISISLDNELDEFEYMLSPL